MSGVSGVGIGVGLDFGTSNSTVAWFDGQQLRYVSLESAGLETSETASPILPTAIHLNRNYESLTGSDAINRYVEENRARRVEMVAEVIGEAASAIGDTGRSNDLETPRNFIYGPLTDRGLPGRLFHGLKRLLGDKNIDRLSVFDRQFRLVALITPVLLRMRMGVEETLRRSVQRIHVGRPVNFEGNDAARNAVAVARLTEAIEHAGFRGQQFYFEPVAATLSYLWRARPKEKGIALTVDFGGGTLDLSVISYSGSEFNVLATDGVGLGGNRIDQLIFEHVLFPLLGKGESFTRRVDGRWIETAFPFHEYEAALLNWAITHTLNQNKTKTHVLERIAMGGPAAVKFERLNDLITYNYSYNCLQAIKIAKAALSEVEATTIDIPELNLHIPFTRTQLDDILSTALTTVGSLIDALLVRTQLEYKDIDLVIRTGGSSQIVAVKRLLDERFPGKVVAHDPFTSVAGGLAIANYYGY